MESIWCLDVSKKLGSHEYADMFNDMIRFATIQVAIQLMLVLMDSERFSFFSTEFFLLLLFVLIGVSFYWLVIKKILLFT